MHLAHSVVVQKWYASALATVLAAYTCVPWLGHAAVLAIVVTADGSKLSHAQGRDAHQTRHKGQGATYSDDNVANLCIAFGQHENVSAYRV